jgi:hypothetical protein
VPSACCPFESGHGSNLIIYTTMKYNLVISRTYVTEIEVTADNMQEALTWASTNQDEIYEQELEQCNVIDEDINIREVQTI